MFNLSELDPPKDPALQQNTENFPTEGGAGRLNTGEAGGGLYYMGADKTGVTGPKDLTMAGGATTQFDGAT